MTVGIQKVWLSLLCLSVLPMVYGAELRTWTFSRDGQMRTSSGGTVSFKNKGRLDGVFIRLETTNVMLLSTHGEYLILPAISFSEADRTYLRRASGIEDVDVAVAGQTDLVRNEMSRRRREAASLRDVATSTRNLSQIELDDAEQLDREAASLSSRATNLVAQTHVLSQKTGPEGVNLPASISPPETVSYFKAKSDAAIVSSAAKQLEQDATKLRRQAQDKRENAKKLSKKAADLEETAQSLETNAVPQAASSH